MACGKPVLCGIRGEAESIVVGAGAGAMFEPDNDEQLGKLVVDLLRDKALAKKMGAGGLSYVKSRFSALKMRRQMESLLSAVASNRGTPETYRGGQV